MSTLEIRIFLEPNGKCPTIGKYGDAGIDVYADIPHPMIIKQFDQVKIPLGFRYGIWLMDRKFNQVSFERDEYITPDYWLEVKNRSGVGTKSGMVELAQVCDSSYRGIPHYCAVKVTPGEYFIHPGDKIAQILIHPFVDPHKVDIIMVETIEALGTTDRGSKGFGGSGQ